VASLAADIGSSSGAQALVDHAVRELGGLDILVHSAGIWPVEESAVHDMTTNGGRRRCARMSTPPLHLTRRGAGDARRTRASIGAAGNMRRAEAHRTSASLLSANPGNRTAAAHCARASTAGQRGESMHADYGASKGAMISFVKVDGGRAAPHDIT